MKKRAQHKAQPAKAAAKPQQPQKPQQPPKKKSEQRVPAWQRILSVTVNVRIFIPVVCDTKLIDFDERSHCYCATQSFNALLC